jgi:tripartite-type tricarboxylate transporter receptor subunit TctC
MQRRIWCPALMLAATLAAEQGVAQQYPAKPIRMVVAFAAGGPNDVIARIIGQKLTEAFGYAVVIDNRPGAGGNVGTTLAAKAARDGYTLSMPGLHFVVNPSLFDSAGYDALKDFAPVTLAAISPCIIMAHPTFPARDVRELVQLARNSKVDFGSPGTGTAGHLAGELLNMVAGIKMQQIPYKGAALAVNDLLGGQIKLAITASPVATPLVKAGKLRAIAVTSLQRSAALPDVPTVAESGYPGFSTDNMYGVVATAGTPRAVVEKLNREIVRIVQAPDMKERLISQGYDPIGNSPEEFAAYLRSEFVKWQKVVKQTGIRVD